MHPCYKIVAGNSQQETAKPPTANSHQPTIKLYNAMLKRKNKIVIKR